MSSNSPMNIVPVVWLLSSSTLCVINSSNICVSVNHSKNNLILFEFTALQNNSFCNDKNFQNHFHHNLVKLFSKNISCITFVCSNFVFAFQFSNNTNSNLEHRFPILLCTNVLRIVSSCFHKKSKKRFKHHCIPWSIHIWTFVYKIRILN